MPGRAVSLEDDVLALIAPPAAAAIRADAERQQRPVRDAIKQALYVYAAELLIGAHPELRPPSKAAEERDGLRRLLYEVVREVPVGDAGVHRNHDLQQLHRRVIEALGEDDPGGLVPSDYWLGRTP